MNEEEKTPYHKKLELVLRGLRLFEEHEIEVDSRGYPHEVEVYQRVPLGLKYLFKGIVHSDLSASHASCCTFIPCGDSFFNN
jgi:hypothetical protein